MARPAKGRKDRRRAAPGGRRAAREPPGSRQETLRVGGQLAGPADGPLSRALQAGAPVKQRGVAAGARPAGGRVLQFLAGQVARAVLPQPPAQPRPGSKKRLMGDLDRVPRDGEQPGAGIRIDHGRGRTAGTQGSDANRAPDVIVGTVADLYQAQENHPGLAPPGIAQPGVNTLGALPHGVLDAAGGPVALQGQRHPVALLPGRPQRVRQQRQPPGVVVPGQVLSRRVPLPAAGPQVREQDLDQPRFDLEPGCCGRAADRLPQLLR